VICSEYLDLVPDLLLENVEPERRTEAAAHASACGPCGALLQAERDLDSAIRGATALISPPLGALGKARRAMIGGPPPIAKWIATAAAVLLLAGAGVLPFWFSEPATAGSLAKRAAELHRTASARELPACCMDEADLRADLGASAPLDDVLPLMARRGWRLAEGTRTPQWRGGSSLTFRKKQILLTCLMVPDPGIELIDPVTAEGSGAVYQVIQADGLTHLVQKVAGLGDTGPLVCILSANTDPATLADLALAADARTDAPPSASGGAPLQVGIGGMHCDHCRGVVRATLESIPDVVKADVVRSGETGSAYLSIGLRVTDRDALLATARAALEDAGFTLEARSGSGR
jgi:copper chaperone CopZ